MSNIQRVNISLLKNYKNTFNNEKNNFKNNIHNTFSSSYLKTCSDYYVLKMGQNLSILLNDLNNSYNKIDKWWEDYNKNIDSLEKYLSGQGGLGSITESSVRGFISSKLDLLEDYNKQSESKFKRITTNSKFTMNTVVNNFSSLFSDYKDVGNKVKTKLNDFTQTINEYTKAQMTTEQITSNLLIEYGKKGLENVGKKLENVIGSLTKTVSDNIKNTKANFVSSDKLSINSITDALFIMNIFNELNSKISSNKIIEKNSTENNFLSGIKKLYNTIIQNEQIRIDNNIRQTQTQIDVSKSINNEISSNFKKVWNSIIENQNITIEKNIQNTQAHVHVVNDINNNLSNSLKNMWESYVFHQNNLSKIEQECSQNTLATTATIGVSTLEGLETLGEKFIDGFLSFSALYGDSMTFHQYKNGQISEDTYKSIESVSESIRPYIQEEHVKNTFDNMYEKTELGKYLKENTYAFDNVRQISSEISYTVGIMVVTYGNPLAAAGVAGVAGIGRGTEDAYNNGATTEEGSLYGLSTGIWEAIQYYVGAKIGMEGGWGNKIVDHIFKSGTATTKQLLTSFTRIGLDGADGAIEGFVQPLLQKIYKDGTYSELFEENGGWSYVATNGIIGAGASTIGEVFDLAKLFKNNESVIDVEMTTKPEVEIDKVPKKSIVSVNKFDEILENMNVFRSKSNNVEVDVNSNTVSGATFGKTILSNDIDVVALSGTSINLKLKESMKIMDEFGIKNKYPNYGKAALENYAKTGSIYQTVKGKTNSYIPSENGVRNFIASLDPSDVKKYLEFDDNMKNAIKILDEQGGPGYGIKALENYVKTGTAFQQIDGKLKPYITNKNGTRDFITSLTPTQIAEYLGMDNIIKNSTMVDSIAQESYNLLKNTDFISKNFSAEQINKALNLNIHTYATEKEFLEAYGHSWGGRLDGFNRGNEIHINPKYDGPHVRIHECLHNITSEFDSNGKKIVTGFEYFDKIRINDYSNGDLFFNEGATDYLTSKIVGDGCQSGDYYRSYKFWEELDSILEIKYGKNDIIFESYKNHDVTIIKNFLDNYGGKGSFDKIVKNVGPGSGGYIVNEILDNIRINITKELNPSATQKITNKLKSIFGG